MIADTKMTEHALCRMQQRGMTKSTMSFVLEHADRDKFVGAGCREHWISRKQLIRLRKTGVSSQLVERSTGIAFIVAADGTIVTVFHKTERTRNKKNKQHIQVH